MDLCERLVQLARDLRKCFLRSRADELFYQPPPPPPPELLLPPPPLLPPDPPELGFETPAATTPTALTHEPLAPPPENMPPPPVHEGALALADCDVDEEE